jgi:hypothetical protein
MTITPRDVEALYQLYKRYEQAFAILCKEQVDEGDAAAFSDHVKRFDDARRAMQDAKYAWERSRTRSLQPQT